MGVIVWLLIPVAAMVVAMVWTAALSRRERRRADEKWRAARLAERGAVLVRDPGVAGHSTPGTAQGSSSAQHEDRINP